MVVSSWHGLVHLSGTRVRPMVSSEPVSTSVVDWDGLQDLVLGTAVRLLVPDPRTRLGLVLRLARERSGLTQAELAGRVGTGRGVITRLELGVIRRPRPALIAAISGVVDAPVDVVSMLAVPAKGS